MKGFRIPLIFTKRRESFIQTFEIIRYSYEFSSNRTKTKKKGKRKKKKKNLIIEKEKGRFNPEGGSSFSNLCLLNRITVWNKLPRQVCPRFSGLTTLLLNDSIHRYGVSKRDYGWLTLNRIWWKKRQALPNRHLNEPSCYRGLDRITLGKH